VRDLTFEEIDEQLAEQLPSRELMGSSCCRSSCCNPCQPECVITVKVGLCLSL
jgi:hypothetical protein